MEIEVCKVVGQTKEAGRMSLLHDERGSVMYEYVIIAAVILLVLVAIRSFALGDSLHWARLGVSTVISIGWILIQVGAFREDGASAAVISGSVIFIWLPVFILGGFVDFWVRHIGIVGFSVCMAFWPLFVFACLAFLAWLAKPTKTYLPIEVRTGGSVDFLARRENAKVSDAVVCFSEEGLFRVHLPKGWNGTCQKQETASPYRDERFKGVSFSSRSIKNYEASYWADPATWWDYRTFYVFKGLRQFEWVAIQHLDEVATYYDLTDWVEFDVRHVGMPELNPPEEYKADLPKKPIDFRRVPCRDDAFLSAQNADDMVAYEGALEIRGVICRLFIIVVRKGWDGWKVELVFPSENATLNDMSQEDRDIASRMFTGFQICKKRAGKRVKIVAGLILIGILFLILGFVASMAYVKSVVATVAEERG